MDLTRDAHAEDPIAQNRVLTRRELRARESATTPVRPPRRRVTARDIAAKALTLSAMAFVALLTVGVSIPASAFGGYEGQSSLTRAAAAVGAPQVFQVSSTAIDASGERDGYQTTTKAQFEAAQAAAAAAANAKKAASLRAVMGFNPTGTGPVRWPYPYSVKLGPGFGAPATCSGCQRVHQGQDFLAPNGAPIYAIAAGVVIEHSTNTTFGNCIVIQHSIDGQTVTSRYAHTQTGSSPLNVGDTVAVGQFVGLTGTTGAVTAPHLHLEIEVNGVHVDPYAYLQAHAG